jgi:hypothetical protein
MTKEYWDAFNALGAGQDNATLTPTLTSTQTTPSHLQRIGQGFQNELSGIGNALSSGWDSPLASAKEAVVGIPGTLKDIAQHYYGYVPGVSGHDVVGKVEDAPISTILDLLMAGGAARGIKGAISAKPAFQTPRALLPEQGGGPFNMGGQISDSFKPPVNEVAPTLTGKASSTSEELLSSIETPGAGMNVSKSGTVPENVSPKASVIDVIAKEAADAGMSVEDYAKSELSGTRGTAEDMLTGKVPSVPTTTLADLEQQIGTGEASVGNTRVTLYKMKDGYGVEITENGITRPMYSQSLTADEAKRAALVYLKRQLRK